MISLREYSGHRPHSLRRRSMLAGIVGIVASVLLVACGGSGGPNATAPIPTVPPTATSAVAPSPAASRQASVATAPVAATQIASVTAPVPIATGTPTVATPSAVPNANAGAATGKIDPCTLVTKADYLAVMGDAANDPVKKDRPTGATSGFSYSSCEYKIAAGNKVEFVTVNVMQRDPSAPAGIDLKTYWEGTKKAWVTMQSKVTPLPEIGPEVFLVVNPTLEQIGAGGAVHFLKGDVIFDVQAVTGSGTVDEQNAAGTVAAKKLATIAFGRL